MSRDHVQAERVLALDAVREARQMHPVGTEDDIVMKTAGKILAFLRKAGQVPAPKRRSAGFVEFRDRRRPAPKSGL